MKSRVIRSLRKGLSPIEAVSFAKRRSIVERLMRKWQVGSPRDRLSCVLITVDCMRLDRTSLVRSGDTTPFLRRLSERCSAFLNVKSTSSWTWPAVASLLTGATPSRHGAGYFTEKRYFSVVHPPRGMNPDVLSLPDLMNHMGYLTYLDTGGNVLLRLLLRGRYRRVVDRRAATPAEQVTRALKFAQEATRQERPFFVHIHINSLHEPISVAGKILKQFGGGVEYTEEYRRWNYDLFRFKSEGVDSNAVNDRREDYLRKRMALYDLALRSVDLTIEAAFHGFREIDSGDGLVFVVTSDHGEEFGEHVNLEVGRFYDPRGVYGVAHGHNVFRELVDVPLIVCGPGLPIGVNYKLNSIAGIVPTLLNRIMILEHSVPWWGSGDLLDGEPTVVCEEMAYGYEKKAIYLSEGTSGEGCTKYLISEGDRIYWKFDLKSDPWEREPEPVNREEARRAMNLAIGVKSPP